MDTGLRFLKEQVDNAVMQHSGFIDSLVAHESEAGDQRFRDLCARHIPRMRQHQRMLEELQQRLGGAAGDDSSITGTVKRLAGNALGVAKELADAAPQSDYLRLVTDIVMARQSEDTFKTFREAGRTLAITALSQLGDLAERHHDDYVKEANRLAQQMFVEQARGAEQVARAVTWQPEV